MIIKIYKFLIIFIITCIIFLFFLELILRVNSNLINENIKNFFPNTIVKEKLFQVDNNSSAKFFKQKIGQYYFKLINKTYFYPSSSKDVMLGAKNQMFYKNGFCNKSIDQTNQHIIAVGDSFTYCTQLTSSEAWIKNAFKSLKYKNAINFGIPGTGPFHYNELLRGNINKNTKLIFYAYYEGNDLRDMFKFKSDQNRGKNLKDKNFLIKTYLKKIFGGSYGINYIYAIYKFYKATYFYKKSIDFRYKRVSFNQIFNIGNSDLDEVDFAKKINHEYNLNSNKVLSSFFNLLSESFSEANKIAKNNNSFIVFIYIPSAYTAFGNDVLFYDKNIKKIVNNYSIISQKKFDDVCKLHQLECINTVPFFVKYNMENSKPSHFPWSVHLTKEGNELISQNIKHYVCKKLLEDKFIRKICNIK